MHVDFAILIPISEERVSPITDDISRFRRKYVPVLVLLSD